MNVKSLFKASRCLGIALGLMTFGFSTQTWAAAVTPPDTSVCSSQTCEDLPTQICDEGGFKVSLKSYEAASSSNSGTATYVYEVCSPNLGFCVAPNGETTTESCNDNSYCINKFGTNSTCNRECAVDDFHGLSHFDLQFPELGNSCLSENNEVTGSCSNGTFTLGDGSCFEGGTSNSFIAKCDDTSLDPGQCLTMTLRIAGEQVGLGLGAALVVSKDSTSCNASCLAGPSCDSCLEPPTPNKCLTRTIGFWGTHPWITNNYATSSDPVLVCGHALSCNGADDGKSNPSCEYGSCDDVMEGLGSIGKELPSNQSYVAMIKQLTAVKLNLKATAQLGGNCADWSYDGKDIQQWVAYCEGLCSADKATISNSGCIEALDNFNQDQDNGFDVTPAPFDRPSVDDHNHVSGADSSSFTAAQGGKGKSGSSFVIDNSTCPIN